MDPPCSIEQLPKALLLKIFEFLPRRDLLSATLVCSGWNSSIGSSSKLMDHLTLLIGRGLAKDDTRDICLEYFNYVSRSVRHYRKVVMWPYDERSLAVALLALRKFGPHLRELSLDSIKVHLMPASRMMELELGLDDNDLNAWQQELDSLDRSMFPIDEYIEDLIKPALDKQLREPQIEELFCAVAYRHCYRLEKLNVEYWKSYPYSQLVRFSLHEGSPMEHLREMKINQAGHVVVAKSHSLRKLELICTRARPRFYATLGHTFPMLTHLEIISEYHFDDSCMWAISKHCSRLEELTLTESELTQRGLRHIDHLEQLKTLRITHDRSRTRTDTAHGFDALALEYLFISCHEMKLETVRRMLINNVNLKRLTIDAGGYTNAGHETCPLQWYDEMQAIRPTCKTIMY